MAWYDLILAFLRNLNLFHNFKQKKSYAITYISKSSRASELTGQTIIWHQFSPLIVLLKSIYYILSRKRLDLDFD